MSFRPWTSSVSGLVRQSPVADSAVWSGPLRINRSGRQGCFPGLSQHASLLTTLLEEPVRPAPLTKDPPHEPQPSFSDCLVPGPPAEPGAARAAGGRRLLPPDERANAVRVHRG